MLVLIFLIHIKIGLVSSQSFNCYNKNDCVKAIGEVAGKILCYGDNSCESAHLTLTNGTETRCYGSYSCSNAILAMQSSTTDLLCNGLFSCKNAFILRYGGPGNILCRGEGSCFGSTIGTTPDDTVNNQQLMLSCEGYKSCANASVYTNYNVSLRGAYSATNTVFNNINAYVLDTNANASRSNVHVYTYNFEGMYSGYNASIICINGSVCTIKCYVNACNNLTVLCQDASGNSDNNCTINVVCNQDAHVSYLCPNGTEFEYFAPDINQMGTFTSQENSVYNCNANKTTAIVCDDTAECEKATFLDTSIVNSSHYNVPICCSSYSGCGKALNITSMIDINDSNIIDNVGVRCDAQYSCIQINDTVRSLTNGGNLYFTAMQALTGSIDTNIKVGLLELN